MARTFAECQAMVEACQEAGVPLFVAYYRRLLPRFIKVKDLLAADIIGPPRTVNITLHRPPLPISPEAQTDPSLLPWRVQPEISGGGLFVDLACHTLDFLDYLFGPITLAKGYASNQSSPYPAEDVVTGSFVFENGVQGTGTWSFNSFRPQDWVEITGPQGKIGFSTFGEDPIILTNVNGETKFMFRNPYHIQQPLIETVVQALRGEGDCPSTGLSAARTNWVMDQLLGTTQLTEG
jgi:predicted dehydrogenase